MCIRDRIYIIALVIGIGIPISIIYLLNLLRFRIEGRMLTGDDDYKGMVSWTGTMFEYFMPNLLLFFYSFIFILQSAIIKFYINVLDKFDINIYIF